MKGQNTGHMKSCPDYETVNYFKTRQFRADYYLLLDKDVEFSESMKYHIRTQPTQDKSDPRILPPGSQICSYLKSLFLAYSLNKPLAVLQYIKGAYKKAGEGHFIKDCRDRTRGNEFKPK